MADVFLSYAREDRRTAQLMAAAFSARGWSVWWDQRATPGAPFDTEIEDQLAAAQCVLALWSAHSIGSAWVKNEASEAAERHVLIPVLIDDVRLPLAFRHLHAASLFDQADIESNVDWQALIAQMSVLAPLPVAGRGPAADDPAGSATSQLASNDASETIEGPVAGMLVAESGVLKGASARISIPVEPAALVIGRTASTSDIVLDDHTVSRTHAEIRATEDSVDLTDLNSAAGTFVNGVWIKTCRLREGDVIRFGASNTFRFHRTAFRGAPLGCIALAGTTDEAVDSATRVLIDPRLGLHIVADSPSVANEVAAALALEVTHDFLDRTEIPSDFTWPFGPKPELSYDANRLSNALRLADRVLLRRTDAFAETPLITGLVAAFVRPPDLYVSGLGRPQCYLFRSGTTPQLLFDLRSGTAVSRPGGQAALAATASDTCVFGMDIVGIRVDSHVIGPGDVVLLTSHPVADVADAVKDRLVFTVEESLSSAVSALQDAAATSRAEPFHFVVIQIR